MESFDVVMVGPVARDVISARGSEDVLTGGGAWYGAFPLISLGLSVAIVTRLRRDDMHHLEPLKHAGVRLYARESLQTTGIRNVYLDESMEQRSCTVLGSCGAILPEDLPAVKARVYYNAALMRGEVPLETVRAMARVAPVCLDLQGYLRFRRNDDLPTGTYPGLEELLSHVTWLKADLAEARMATGIADSEEAALTLASMGPEHVIVTGNGKVRLYSDGRFLEAPLESHGQAGRTGRGDTCTATFVGAVLRGDPQEGALQLAAWVTSRKVETPGPYLGPTVLPDGSIGS